jgi:hypothetical protein
MSNVNRFNVLLKDNFNNVIKSTKSASGMRNNAFAAETTHSTSNTLNNVKNRFVSKEVNEERNKKLKNELFIKSLDSSEAFPELQNKKSNIVMNNDTVDDIEKTNFLDIIKMNNDAKKDNNDSDKDNIIPPGCVCIQYDKESKKLLWSYGSEIKKNNFIMNQDIKTEEEPYDVMERVVELYKNRKNDYIKKWGIEEYDKMFLFQNYDYDYFDKLDEKTERVIKKNLHYYANNINNTYTD